MNAWVAQRTKLVRFGWSEALEQALAESHAHALVPARVAGAQREHYRLWSEDASFTAAVSGKLRHAAESGELPVVGDWVAVQRLGEGERATIHAVLPRRGALVRQQAGPTGATQVLAAHVDVAFLVSSLNKDWNARRIERALAMIRSAGVQPVLLLSKLDLTADPTATLAAAHEVAAGVPVHTISVHRQLGVAELERYLVPGVTVVLIGSSGVGKSTLVNHFLGEDRAATGGIRATDDKGRHTTTHRELFELPAGGLLIDTPGMREFGHWNAESVLDEAFEDIGELARTCRFHDCGHRSEPGCGILAALEAGTLESSRWTAYQRRAALGSGPPQRRAARRPRKGR